MREIWFLLLCFPVDNRRQLSTSASPKWHTAHLTRAFSLTNNDRAPLRESKKWGTLKVPRWREEGVGINGTHACGAPVNRLMSAVSFVSFSSPPPPPSFFRCAVSAADHQYALWRLFSDEQSEAVPGKRD